MGYTEQKNEKIEPKNVLNEQSAHPIPPLRQKRKVHKEDLTKSQHNVEYGTHNQNDKKQASENKTDYKDENDCQEMQLPEKVAGTDLKLRIKLVLL